MANNSENALNISSTENLAENPILTSENERRNPEFRLEFLCSLIPKSFDGKRTEFNEFIANCNNACLLASDSQKHPLLVYIISKLTGTVRTQLHGKTYATWQELRNILNQLYLDKKHYVQLMEELNTLKQSHNESVSSFHDRIDQLSMRIINSLTFKNENEELGKIETIKELALSRFIYHSNPEISRFLRSQNLEKLSDALTKASEEERALKISQNEYKRPSQNTKFCNVCNRSGHQTKDCFKNSSRHQIKSHVFVNQPNSNQFNNTQRNHKFCRYCKATGHLINECRKREYANKQRHNNQNHYRNNNANHNSAINNQNSSNSNINAVNLNSFQPQVDAAPVDVDIFQA